MIREYPVFYSYIVFMLSVEVLRSVLLSLFGIQSRPYYYAYYWPTYLMSAFQFALIWSVHSEVFGFSKTLKRLASFFLIVSFLMLPLVWKVLELGGSHDFYKFHILALFVQMASCVFVCRDLYMERGKIGIGLNLFGILTGTSLMVGSQTINFGAFLLLNTSEHAFWFLIPFLYFLALSVLAYTFWSYDPLRRKTET